MDGRLESSLSLREDSATELTETDDTTTIQHKMVEDLKDFIRKDENTEINFLTLYQDSKIIQFTDLVIHLLKQLDENHQEDLRKFLRERLAHTHLASGDAVKDTLKENIVDNLTISGALGIFATFIGGPIAGGGVFVASEAFKTGYDLVKSLVRHDKLTTQKATAIHFILNSVHPEIMNPNQTVVATPSVLTTVASYFPTIPKLSTAISSLWRSQAATPSSSDAVEMEDVLGAKKTI